MWRRMRIILRKLLRAFKVVLNANLVAGLLFLLPVAGTFLILDLLFTLVDKGLSRLPASLHPDSFLPFHIPGLGIIIVLIFVLITGFIVRNIVGKRLVAAWDKIFSRIPLVSKFYKAIKQLVDSIFVSGRDFKRVVLIEYPRLGVYTLGFVTGVAGGEIQEKIPRHVVNLFVPTTPNPTSGFYLMVPEEDLIPLDISVEDAFKLLISGGIISPESQKAAANSRDAKQPENISVEDKA